MRSAIHQSAEYSDAEPNEQTWEFWDICTYAYVAELHKRRWMQGRG